MKTVILLIDFDGHKILADEYVNKLRYSTLQHITADTTIDRKNNIILSIGNSGRDKKLQEIFFLKVLYNQFSFNLILFYLNN